MKGRNEVSVGFAGNALLVAALLVAGTHSRLQAQQPNAWQINDNSSITGVLEYVTNLTTVQVATAKTNGWHYSLLSRILADTSSPAANGMAFGDGTRRFYIYFDLDSSGNLTAQLVSSSNVTYTLSLPAPDVLKYHLHEMIYDPVTSKATYRFDGNVIASWAGDLSSSQSNQVLWGANASLGKGTMNYHRAEFDITGQGAIATYDAGFAGNPVSAPLPTSQGWTRVSSGVTLPESALSPDGEFIHPVVITTNASPLRPGEGSLNGIINPNGWPAVGWFDHGPTTSYGYSTSMTAVGSGTAFVTNSALVTGLARGAAYHFRAVTSNSVGAIYGSDLSFTVPDSAPIPSTPSGGGQALSIQQPSLELNYLICTNGSFPTQDGGVTPGFLGEMRLFAGNFAPAGWLLCQGQLLSIPDNEALFNVLGTTYGGDGVTTFGLPDLRGRTVTGMGTAFGETWSEGRIGGSTQVTITVQQIPAHTHSLTSPYSVTGSTGGSQPRSNRQPSLGLAFLVWLQGLYPSSDQAVFEPFLGQISIFAGNFAVKGSALTTGQLLPINQNQALYSVLGTNFGGNGQTTFALPDVQVRTPLGAGQGPGLSAWLVGQTTGSSAVTMSQAQLPTHQHAVPWLPPFGFSTGLTGSNQPQSLMQPSLALQCLIATNGEVPSLSVQATNRMLGEIQLFGGTNVPGGWAPCNGQLLQVAAYPALFSVLSNTFGGDGVSTFALPNLASRIPFGPTNNQPGATYGAEQAVLTVAQMPAHTHTVPALDYDRWVTAFGLSNSVAAFDFDSDNDGVKNGFEWATGTTPTDAASFLPLTITSAGQQVNVQFTRNTNATDVVFYLQRTTNLPDANAWTGLATNVGGAWSPAAIVSETGPNPVNVQVSDSVTHSPAASYRLNLTQP